MNKYLKWAIIVAIACPILFAIYWFWCVFTIFDMPEITYRKKDLIENYTLKSREINELKQYVELITPKHKTVDIEFDNNRNLGIFHVIEEGNYDNNWNVPINSLKADTLLNKLHWNRQILKTLKEKLDKANCISVNTDKPFTVGFQRSGMGIYFYKIFDKLLTDSLKKEYDDGCTFIFYKDNIVLEFGGGAIGQQCFENFK